MNGPDRGAVFDRLDTNHDGNDQPPGVHGRAAAGSQEHA